MAGDIARAVLLLTVLLSTATSKMPKLKRPNFEQTNIKTFMNTTDPISTYNSTLNSTNILCKVDRMVNISDKVIYYNRTMLYKGNKTGYPVQGDFFPEGSSEPYSILFGQPGGWKNGYEVILYASDNYSCAVINVTLSDGFSFDGFWYDLRVLNSSVEQGPSQGCQEVYRRYAPNSTQMYFPYCQQTIEAPLVHEIYLAEAKASFTLNS